MNRRTVILTTAAMAFSVSAALAATRIEKEWPLAAGGAVTVDVSDGAISVVGSNRSTVRMVLTAEIDGFDTKFESQFSAKADQVSIRIKRKEGSWGFISRMMEHGANVKLALEVPREAKIVADTAGGPVSAVTIDGTVQLSTSGGPITLEEIAGDVMGETSGGPIRATRIRGNARLSTSGGGIEVDGVSGDLLAETSGGPIEIRGAGGKVEASTSGGGISVEFTKGNAKGGVIESSAGGIEVRIDPAVALKITAETSAGRIRQEFGSRFTTTADEGDSLVGTLNGGGATLAISTSAGGVQILPL